jgi:phosphinothricin acetyltransferase
MLTIRPASENDIHRIMEIYNEAILNTTATFDTEIKTLDERLSWYRQHDEKHPVIVA